jgi:uncharacterized OsmC-like protein
MSPAPAPASTLGFFAAGAAGCDAVAMASVLESKRVDVNDGAARSRLSKCARDRSPGVPHLSRFYFFKKSARDF